MGARGEEPGEPPWMHHCSGQMENCAVVWRASRGVDAVLLCCVVVDRCSTVVVFISRYSAVCLTDMFTRDACSRVLAWCVCVCVHHRQTVASLYSSIQLPAFMVQVMLHYISCRQNTDFLAVSVRKSSNPVQASFSHSALPDSLSAGFRG